MCSLDISKAELNDFKRCARVSVAKLRIFVDSLVVAFCVQCRGSVVEGFKGEMGI